MKLEIDKIKITMSQETFKGLKEELETLIHEHADFWQQESVSVLTSYPRIAQLLNSLHVIDREDIPF